MNTVLNNIDTSNTSLFISSIIFVIVTFVTKYFIDKQNEEDDKEVWFSSLVSPTIGLIFTISSLYLYKRLNSDRNDILTEPFNSKINVV